MKLSKIFTALTIASVVVPAGMAHSLRKNKLLNPIISSTDILRTDKVYDLDSKGKLLRTRKNKRIHKSTCINQQNDTTDGIPKPYFPEEDDGVPKPYLPENFEFKYVSPKERKELWDGSFIFYYEDGKQTITAPRIRQTEALFRRNIDPKSLIMEPLGIFSVTKFSATKFTGPITFEESE